LLADSLFDHCTLMEPHLTGVANTGYFCNQSTETIYSTSRVNENCSVIQCLHSCESLCDIDIVL